MGVGQGHERVVKLALAPVELPDLEIRPFDGPPDLGLEPGAEAHVVRIVADVSTEAGEVESPERRGHQGYST